MSKVSKGLIYVEVNKENYTKPIVVLYVASYL
jgi:hypothetical protein